MPGIGIVFSSSTGTPSRLVTVEEQVESNIKSTLLMGDFDLPYMPNSGGGLWALISDRVTDLKVRLIESRLLTLLREVEPRVDILNVSVSVREGAERNVVDVQVEYSIKGQYKSTSVTVTK